MSDVCMIERIKGVILNTVSIDNNWGAPTVEDVAKAILEAMREPNSDMTKAGSECVQLKNMAKSYCAQATYTTMIDAALKDSGSG